MEDHKGAVTYLEQESHTLGRPKGGCDPVESPHCTRLLAGGGVERGWCAPGGLWRGAHAGAGLVTRWGPHAGAVHRVTCGMDSLWSSSQRTVSHGSEPMLEQGKSVRSLPPEEGAADTTCNELTSICATPSSTPVTPQCDWGGRNMQFQSKIKPKMREGWGEGGFKIWDNFFFFSSYFNW